MSEGSFKLGSVCTLPAVRQTVSRNVVATYEIGRVRWVGKEFTSDRKVQL